MRFNALNFGRLISVLAIGLTILFALAEATDARRALGGGFGSRGTRTFQTPATTNVAPTPAVPIGRSMAPVPQANQTPPLQPQSGLFGNFGRSFVGGLLVGGLIGAVLGNGFGGAAGILGMLLQIGLLFVVIALVMRFMRGRQQASAGVGAGMFGASTGFASQATQAPGGNAAPGAFRQTRQTDEIGITKDDLNTFERLLGEVQTAYGHEDYATLRRYTTPEAMSYLAEELGENATRGVRNSVSDVRLLQGDIAEAWREGDTDYATLAMRYSSVDATLDRATGKVVEGDAKNATEATEVWTFARRRGTDWLLSAIQAT